MVSFMRTWRIHLLWAIVTVVVAAAWGRITVSRMERLIHERAMAPPAGPSPSQVSPASSGARHEATVLHGDDPVQKDPSVARAATNTPPPAEALDADEIRTLLQSSSQQDLLRALASIDQLTDRALKLGLLKAALAVKDDYLVGKAISRLGLLGGPESGEALIQVMKSDRVNWLKERAAGFLGQTGGPGALEALLETYRSDSFYLQVVAAGSLYRLGHPTPSAEMLPRVAIMLDNTDGSVRRDGVEQLGHLVTPAALPLLMRGLQDSNGDVRMEAVRGLRWLRIPEAVPLLEKALADPNSGVVEEAKIALMELRQVQESRKK